MIIEASKFSVYDSKNFPNSRNYEDPESPTKESEEITKKTLKFEPLNVKSKYTIDLYTKMLIDEKNKKLPGFDALENIFQAHIKSSFSIFGILIRLKISTNNIKIKFLEIIQKIIEWILTKIYNRIIKPSDYFHTYFSNKGLTEEEIPVSIDEKNQFSLFGYTTSKQTIIAYAIFVYSLYTFGFFFLPKYKYLHFINSNAYLSLLTMIILLWIFDIIIPKLLLYLYNKTIYKIFLLTQKTFKV